MILIGFSFWVIMNNEETKKINQFEPILGFQWTWPFKMFLILPFDKIAFFTGNQYGKTSSFAVNYVFRIMGWHPIPKKNVLYFECPKLVEEEKAASKIDDDSLITHPWVQRRLPDKSMLNIHREGEYYDSAFYPSVFPKRFSRSVRPKDNRCAFCGEKLRIHKRKTRIFRFASEVLPGDKESTDGLDGQSTEVRNAIYPEFKKWLPAFLIKKDITSRRLAMTIFDPNTGQAFGDIEYPGADIVVEFVAYHQTVQSGAGVQRLSVWADESCPMNFYEEQMPRLVAEDGDFLNSLTPAERVGWEYDELFERAQLYIRTQAICEFLKKEEKKDVKSIEWTDSLYEIAVIQAATDDNPTLSKKAIEKKYFYDDPNTVATRRYGIFRQSTGRIFNDFSWKMHVIDLYDYFPDGVDRFELPWIHARSADYHERNPWAIIWISLSPKDEAFVYREWNPDPAKWVNYTIAEEVAHRSGMQRYIMNLIDPLARKIQTNTGISVIEDLNRAFYQFKKDGVCQGGYWEPFDTKGTKGRDEIKKRLKNSMRVGKPFSNEIVEGGRRFLLPTIWISKQCPEGAKSLKHWRYEDWATARVIVSKDKKETPMQKFSHFCTALEGVFKDNRFKARHEREFHVKHNKIPKYFQLRG